MTPPPAIVITTSDVIMLWDSSVPYLLMNENRFNATVNITALPEGQTAYVTATAVHKGMFSKTVQLPVHHSLQVGRIF